MKTYPAIEETHPRAAERARSRHDSLLIVPTARRRSSSGARATSQGESNGRSGFCVLQEGLSCSLGVKIGCGVMKGVVSLGKLLLVRTHARPVSRSQAQQTAHTSRRERPVSLFTQDSLGLRGTGVSAAAAHARTWLGAHAPPASRLTPIARSLSQISAPLTRDCSELTLKLTRIVSVPSDLHLFARNRRPPHTCSEHFRPASARMQHALAPNSKHLQPLSMPSYSLDLLHGSWTPARAPVGRAAPPREPTLWATLAVFGST